MDRQQLYQCVAEVAADLAVLINITFEVGELPRFNDGNNPQVVKRIEG